VAQARGDLAGAERAFTRALAIFERLAALDPASTGWQRDLATARSRTSAVRNNPSEYCSIASPTVGS